jgi:hypothetical protein
MTYHDEPHHAMIYHAVQMNWLYGFAFQGARSVGKQHGYTVHGSAFTIVLSCFAGEARAFSSRGGSFAMVRDGASIASCAASS